MKTDNQIKAWILNKLKRHRYIGGRHTDIVNVRKGAPQKYYKQINKQVEKLIREGIIIIKVTAYGKHISLNPRLMKEINDFIQKYYTKTIFK